MKRFAVAVLVASCMITGAARAQFGAGQPVSGPYPQAVGGPVGSPTYVAPPSSGVINVGQALGPFVQPYVDALVNLLIAAGVTYLGNLLRKKLNVQTDEAHRDALITALQNQAGSLIADGFVKFEKNGKITVQNDQALVNAANEVLHVVPDAAKRLNLNPDYVARRIIDTLPQIAAGAALAAAAHAPAAPAAAPPVPPAPAPAPAPAADAPAAPPVPATA